MIADPDELQELMEDAEFAALAAIVVLARWPRRPGGYPRVLNRLIDMEVFSYS